jgi:hypothetical protein
MSEDNSDFGTWCKPQGIDGDKIPRRAFVPIATIAAVGVAAGLGTERTRDFGESDVDISSALEKEGIKDVEVRMLFGDHYMNSSNLSKVLEMRADIVTGEIHIDDLPSGRDLSPPKDIVETSLAQSFVNNIFSGGGVDRGFLSYAAQEHDYNLEKIYEKGVVVISTEGTKLMSDSTPVIEASSKGANVRQAFLALTTATALGVDLARYARHKQKRFFENGSGSRGLCRS